MSDWIDLGNFLLQRLDRLNELLERIAIALENLGVEQTEKENPR